MAVAGLGKKLVSSLVHGGGTSALLKMGGIGHLFKDHETELWEFVFGHAKKFGSIPKPETVEAHTGVELTPVPEGPEYYRSLMEQRYIEHAIRDAAKTAMEALNPDVKDIDKAFEIMRAMVMDGMVKKQTSLIFDYRDSYEMVIPDYQAKIHKEVGGVLFGWPSLDDKTGGIEAGDLISFVGRPAQGKTWFLLFAALYAWWVQNKRVLFISMEMKPLPIIQRLASMSASVPFGKLRKTSLSTKHLNKLKTTLMEVKHKDAPFWVIDGNLTAMVEDVWALASFLKPDLIEIDGGYLMQHPRERDRFKRVAENCNLIKQNLTPIAPTVVSWQFSRSGAKKNKKKGEQADLEDIGYTDAIAQDSSLVAGLVQPESIETVPEREVLILKGRNGETGKFRTKWDFESMDFHEIEEVALDQLQFL